MCAAGNMAYLHLTVAFVQMLKAFCPVITMLLLFIARLERATTKLVLSVSIISLGVAMASYGEMNLSLFGLAAMLTSVVSESVRLVLTQHLLVGLNFHPLEGLVYIGSACTLWLMIQVRPEQLLHQDSIPPCTGQVDAVKQYTSLHDNVA